MHPPEQSNPSAPPLAKGGKMRTNRTITIILVAGLLLAAIRAVIVGQGTFLPEITSPDSKRMWMREDIPDAVGVKPRQEGGQADEGEGGEGGEGGGGGGGGGGEADKVLDGMEVEEVGQLDGVPSDRDDTSWQQMIVTDVNLLISKAARNLSYTTDVSTGRHSMAGFAFKTHRGGMRGFEMESDFLPFLPERDWNKPKFQSCAIVGNSGVMRGSGWGSEIDSHDAVIRINYAPTRPFESDVGTKTTIDLVNKENTVKLWKGEHRWRESGSILALFEAHSRIIRSQVYIHLIESTGGNTVVGDSQHRHAVPLSKKNLWMLSPVLITVSRGLFQGVKAQVEREIHHARVQLQKQEDGELKGPMDPIKSKLVKEIVTNTGPFHPGGRPYHFHNKPMSGMVATSMATHLCNRVVMYGFDAFKDGTRTRYHYFDKRKGMTEVHSFDLAIEVYRRIAEHYPLEVRGVKKGSRNLL